MQYLALVAALVVPTLALSQPNAAPFVHEAFPVAAQGLEIQGRAVVPSITPDGSCGVVGARVYTCQGGAYGSCCGHTGLCGNDATTCSVASGCNTLYGICDGASSAVTPSVAGRQNPAFTNSSSVATSSPTPGAGNRNPGSSVGPFPNATMSSNSSMTSAMSTSSAGPGSPGVGGRSGSPQGTGGAGGAGGAGSGATVTGSSVNTNAPGFVGSASSAPAGSVCYLFTTMVPMTDNSTSTSTSSTSSSSSVTGSDAGRSGSASSTTPSAMSSTTDSSTTSDTGSATTQDATSTDSATSTDTSTDSATSTDTSSATSTTSP